MNSVYRRREAKHLQGIQVHEALKGIVERETHNEHEEVIHHEIEDGGEDPGVHSKEHRKH